MNGLDGRHKGLQQYVLGTAGLGGVWETVDPEVSVTTVVKALEAGVLLIDTAPAYGDGERFVGEALRYWGGSRPQVSTKVGRLKSYASDKGIYDYTPGGMTKSIEDSLKLLGLSEVDVLFLHEPAAIPLHEVRPAVEAMLMLKQQGYTKKIGLGGNYPPSFIQYLDPGIFSVVMEYNRLNACCVDALDTSLPECKSRNLEYWAASPLHMGLLGCRFQSFVDAKPDWLAQRHVDAAAATHKVAVKANIPLASLAFRFLQHIVFPVNIVMGPSNLQEFEESVAAIFQGPLEQELYNEILSTIMDINHNK